MKQTGVAVIMVLLVLAIVAVTTASLIKRHQYSQAFTSALLHLGQTKAHIQGAQLWAAQVLTADKQANDVDHLGEVWAQTILPIPVEQGVVSGQITDLQGRFNLNNLVSNNAVNQDAMALFQRMLALQELSPQLAWYLVDWIDSNAETEQQSTLEDAYYLGQTIPYRSANQPLVDISELGLVRGFNLASVAKLAPLVSALPEPTKINVNTTSAQVLMAVSDAISASMAKELMESKNKAHWPNDQDFMQAVLGPMSDENKTQWNALKKLITVKSSYFNLQISAQFGVSNTRLESILYRSENGSVNTFSRIYTP
jgi:general secretion pathway protein K